MSVTGGSRVPIPNNVRKMIQNIKEITGKHSDDEIYAMLKECSMDPNETAQKLLFEDTFHEVRRKRDRRKDAKENVNGKGSEDSRRILGTQGRAGRAGRPQYSSHRISHDAGGGRNSAARKENGVSYSTGRGVTDTPTSLPVSQATKSDAKLAANSSATPIDGHVCPGVRASAMDPVLVHSPDSWNLGPVGTTNSEVRNQHIASEPSGKTENHIQIDKTAPDFEGSDLDEKAVSGISNSVGGKMSNNHFQAESIISETVVTSDVATMTVEVDSESAPESVLSVSEEATPKLHKKLEELKVSDGRHVIIPEHLQVPESVLSRLSFGSFDVSVGARIKSIGNAPDSDKGSTPVAEFLQKNEEHAAISSPRNQSASSTAQGDSPNHLESPPQVPENLSFMGNSVEADLRYDHLKQQEIELPPQYSTVPTAPSSNLGILPPMIGSQLLQFEGLDPQGVNSQLLSASATQPTGLVQSSIAMTPHPIPVFRSPYPPNYFPYSHYFSPYFMPPGIHQFLGHSGFPQQTPTGNIYLPTPAAAAAAGGTKFSIPQYKPGSNTGNSTHIGIPTVSEDLTPSQLKDNNSYATGQQSEGSGMWISGPGREMSGLPSNSFYLPPPLAITPPQSGHGGGAYGGIYHPAQPNVHPLVQQSQTMAPSVETVRPPIGAYHQHSLSSQVNWNTTY